MGYENVMQLAFSSRLIECSMSAAQRVRRSFDAKECIFRNTFVNESLLY
jgi:hypothetical protein